MSDHALEQVFEPATPAAETPHFSFDDIIPPSYWGKDHWSTLAYVDTVMVDCGGFEIGSDGRMRSSRRNHRVMAQENPRPRRAQGSYMPAVPMDSAHHSTRLNNGQMVVGHDDWACLQDMAAASLFDTPPEEIEPGTTIRLSRKGRAWCEALREHKRQGGNFAGFSSEQLPDMPEAALGAREWYEFAGNRFDITRLLEDIEAGKLRPKKETLETGFVEQFATRVLALDRTKPDEQQGFSIMMRIEVANARQLPAEVLAKPVILLYAGRKKGLLNIKGEGGTADYVLADGNHRMARSYLDQLGAVQAYILSPDQSRRYKF